MIQWLVPVRDLDPTVWEADLHVAAPPNENGAVLDAGEAGLLLGVSTSDGVGARDCTSLSIVQFPLVVTHGSNKRLK